MCFNTLFINFGNLSLQTMIVKSTNFGPCEKWSPEIKLFMFLLRIHRLKRSGTIRDGITIKLINKFFKRRTFFPEILNPIANMKHLSDCPEFCVYNTQSKGFLQKNLMICNFMNQLNHQRV